MLSGGRSTTTIKVAIGTSGCTLAVAVVRRLLYAFVYLGEKSDAKLNEVEDIRVPTSLRTENMRVVGDQMVEAAREMGNPGEEMGVKNLPLPFGLEKMGSSSRLSWLTSFSSKNTASNSQIETLHGDQNFYRANSQSLDSTQYDGTGRALTSANSNQRRSTLSTGEIQVLTGDGKLIPLKAIVAADDAAIIENTVQCRPFSVPRTIISAHGNSHTFSKSANVTPKRHSVTSQNYRSGGDNMEGNQFAQPIGARKASIVSTMAVQETTALKQRRQTLISDGKVPHRRNPHIVGSDIDPNRKLSISIASTTSTQPFPGSPSKLSFNGSPKRKSSMSGQAASVLASANSGPMPVKSITRLTAPTETILEATDAVSSTPRNVAEAMRKFGERKAKSMAQIRGL